MIKAVIFDFGGVLAEEGFNEGLKAIGKQNGLNSDDFFTAAAELIYQTGYVTGTSDESTYWAELKKKTGIKGNNKELREEILERFKLRTEMLTYAEQIKSSGLATAILSDQTNWLDEINQKTPFFYYFDHVFNSYVLKKDKKDPSIFRDVCSKMGFKPEETIFVDDNIENINRAQAEGLKTIHFIGIEDFKGKIRKFI